MWMHGCTVEAGEITVLRAGVARLNGEIAVAIQQTGQPPNDLLDQRDQLIDQLSAKVGVTVVAEGEFHAQRFHRQWPAAGARHHGVDHHHGRSIRSMRNALQLALQTAAGTVDISRSVSGGTLGGLLDWRREMLDPARNELGRITLAVASQVNAQHREGMDLTGALGGDFFNVGAVGVTYPTTNTGTALATATRTDISAITANDYVLTRTGTGYTLRRQDTGTAVSFTGTGTVADPIVFDGMSLVVGAGAATGDQFVIHPTRDAIQGFDVAITDPARVAAAAPIRASAASSNAGTGTITPGEVLDAGNAQLLTTTNIVFTSATTYSVNGGADVTYTPGGNIDVNGWRVPINGAPATGDTLHRAQQRRRRRRQSQCLRAGRRHAIRRHRRRHGVGLRGRRAHHRQPRPADARRADEP